MILSARTAERRVRCNDDVVVLAELAQVALLEVSVQLHLQHLGLDGCPLHDFVNLTFIEVGQA